MQLIQTSSFRKAVKKLHRNQKNDLDAAVNNITTDPETGKLKSGNLSGLRVHKFKMNKQPVLLAYIHQPTSVVLLALGSHQNFYRDLKHLGG